MKKATKITLGTLAVLLPFALFAGEKHKTYFEDFSDENRVFMQKGINYSFEGNLEKKPLGKINGTWIIDGKEVIVNDDTLIIQDNKFKIGDEIEVLAKRDKGKIFVIQLEQD